MMRPPPSSPLFPYTPLSGPADPPYQVVLPPCQVPLEVRDLPPVTGKSRDLDLPRSEEHTSELQSHLNLVCRLLLEKKKIPNRPHANTHELPHVPPRATDC